MRERATYAATSSQLYMDRARVVSTWRTTSHSKPSLSLKPLTSCLFQASRCGSGIEAVAGEVRARSSEKDYSLGGPMTKGCARHKLCMWTYPGRS